MRRTLRGVALGVAIVAAVGIAAWLPMRGGGASSPSPSTEAPPVIADSRAPSPPVPADLDSAGPALTEPVRRAVEQIRSAPENGDRWLDLAMLYHGNTRLPEAAECYERAIERGAGGARAWRLLADVQARLGDTGSALRSLRKSIDADGSYGPAHSALGMLLLDGGDVEGAEAAFRRAAELDPRADAPWAGLARVALQRDQPRVAIEHVEQRLLAGPNEAYGRHLLAAAYRQSGDGARAAVEAARAKAAQPTWTDPWLAAAFDRDVGLPAALRAVGELQAAGRHEEALGRLAELAERHPESARVESELALGYAKAGDPDRAIDRLRALVERQPDYLQAHLYLALAHQDRILAGHDDFDAAMGAIDRALELSPDSARAHEVRGTLLQDAGRIDEAVEAYTASTRLDPRNTMLFVEIGRVHMQRGRWDEAAAAFAAAAESDPALEQVQLLLATAHIERRDFEAAQRAIDTAAAALPADDPYLAALRRRLDERRPADTPGGRQ